jgi:hypothetical protein
MFLGPEAAKRVKWKRRSVPSVIFGGIGMRTLCFIFNGHVPVLISCSWNLRAKPSGKLRSLVFRMGDLSLEEPEERVV